MRKEIARRLHLQEGGKVLPFCVIDTRTNTPVGMTWYDVSVQRTPLNTEAKSLLLQHAFDTLNCIAVELRTHCFNH